MRKKFKETDIRDDKYLKKIKHYAIQDRKFLFSHKKEFISVACPACGKKRGKFIFIKTGYRYLECRFCQTIYVSPRPTRLLLKRYYQQSKRSYFWNKYVFSKSEKVRRNKIFKPRVDLLLEYCKKLKVKTDKIIEVGAGFGIFCQEIKNRKVFKNVVAIEPASPLAQTCRQKKIKVIEKPIEEVNLKGNRADVIASFETIEHLYSPSNFIFFCNKLLKAKGLIFISCPNVHGFETLVLGRSSKTIGGGHINLFNPASIKILLRRFGFNPLDIKTPGSLDAELVRKSVLAGKFKLKEHPFLKYVLFNKWNEVGDNLQDFLADNLLSSHMFIVARKKS